MLYSAILSVTEAAETPILLTTLEAFKAQMGITVSEKDDLIEQIIARASGRIADTTRRVLARETVAETFRARLNTSGMVTPEAAPLILARYPVSSIQSVTVDGEALAADGYEVDPASGLLYRLSSGFWCSWTGARIVVAYTAGYILPGNSDTNLPPALEEACLGIARMRWFNDSRDPLVKSEDVPDVGSTQYWVGDVPTASSSGLPTDLADTLEPYIDRRL